MAERMIQEWLTEYKSASRSDVSTFSNKIKDNVQLIKSIYDILMDPHSGLQEPVCGQLYEFYRSGHFELKRFCLQFVPAVIWNYLSGLALHKNYGRAESLLLGIYNMEVVEQDGSSRTESFTVPTLAKPSIYHEPVSQLALTENVLSYQQSDHCLVTRTAMSQLNAITAKNRFAVLTHVLAEYNTDIGFLSPVSHAFFCQICSRLVLSGFTAKQLPGRQNREDKAPKRKLILDINKLPRIPLDSVFLLEMLTGVYFAMFNGQATAGMQAVDDIHFRASYELYAEVLLVSNAIRHSLDTNPSGRPSDGPVGINVAVTPPSPVVKRSAITNASFKLRRQKEHHPPPQIENETTITVTIEGVEKTEATSSREGPTNMNEASKSVMSVAKHSRHHGNRAVHSAVDIAVIDQSGSQIVETVEMEEVEVVFESHGTGHANGEADQQTECHSGMTHVTDSAARNTELHMSGIKQTSRLSGSSMETDL